MGRAAAPCAVAGPAGRRHTRCRLHTQTRAPALQAARCRPACLRWPALASTWAPTGFNGSLPAGWSSATLADLDVSANTLTGTLPPDWASGLPKLSMLHLVGNQLQGTLPEPWLAGAFAVPLTLEPRPDNPRLCGPVTPLDPALFPVGHPERNASIIPTANQIHTGSNLTTVIVSRCAARRGAARRGAARRGVAARHAVRRCAGAGALCRACTQGGSSPPALPCPALPRAAAHAARPLHAQHQRHNHNWLGSCAVPCDERE